LSLARVGLQVLENLKICIVENSVVLHNSAIIADKEPVFHPKFVWTACVQTIILFNEATLLAEKPERPFPESRAAIDRQRFPGNE
jgi:hypothetical protein